MGQPNFCHHLLAIIVAMEIQNLDMDKGNQIWSSILVKSFDFKMWNIPTFDWPLSNSHINDQILVATIMEN
jgi:hypothetical protein